MTQSVHVHPAAAGLSPRVISTHVWISCSHRARLISSFAEEFLPYWHQCLDEWDGAIGGDMHVFTVLYTACADGLPEEESPS